MTIAGTLFGLAHSQCNLGKQSLTPVFFHNLSKSDSHHLIQNLVLETDEKKTLVTCSEENYVSFNLHIPVGSYQNKKFVVTTKNEEMNFLCSLRFLTENSNKLIK